MKLTTTKLLIHNWLFLLLYLSLIIFISLIRKIIFFLLFLLDLLHSAIEWLVFRMISRFIWWIMMFNFLIFLRLILFFDDRLLFSFDFAIYLLWLFSSCILKLLRLFKDALIVIDNSKLDFVYWVAFLALNFIRLKHSHWISI